VSRSLTSRNLFEKRTGRTVQLSGILAEAVGGAERRGCWMIYGAEKNGKTWFALTLAKNIAQFERVAYISAEEGLYSSFQNACRRASITVTDKILWNEYMSIDEIIEKYRHPRTPNIVFIDNLTIYTDEIKPGELKKKLINALPNKLIVFVAHEERKDAYPAIARMAKKMANVVIHIRGLKAFITSRFSEGGEMVIDEQKSALFWGEKGTGELRTKN
jgi:predicted ATP-dependent serine protease